MSIRRIFWDKDILSYDDPLDYKLTSNDIRSNAVFLKKIYVLFQIKSKHLFFDLLNAMIQLAEKTTTYVIKKTGWQDNGSYAFGNGVICQTNSANFSIDSRITKYKLYIAPNSEVTPDQERASADLLFSNMEKLNDKTLFYYLYLYHLLALMATPLRERYESRAPRFIVILTGEPSIGKTGICNWLLGYRSYSPTIDISTGSTEAGFFDSVTETSDCIYLTDDFKVNPSHKKQVNELVETLTRVGGNNSSKRTARGSFEMNGSIIITAECLPDLSDSSLNRMVEWHVHSQTENWCYLNAISEQKEKYALHYLSIIRWIQSKGKDELCDNMFAAFQHYKIELQHEYTCERRVDAYAWLLAAYQEFLCKYLADKKIATDESLFKQLYDYALNYLKEYQRDIIEKDIVYLFCQKLCYGNYKFHVSSDSKDLDTKELGFADINSYYIEKDRIDILAKKIGVTDIKTLIKKLNEADLIIKDSNRDGCKRITHRGTQYLTYWISKDGAMKYCHKMAEMISRMK